MRFHHFATCAAVIVLSTGPAWAADTWTSPHPGVRLLSRVETSPAQQIHAAFVSTCEPGMHARATKYSERQARTSTWAQGVGAVVAINGAFFEYTNYNAIGWSIGDGETWPTAYDTSHYGAIGFGSYARVRIFEDEDTFPAASWWREMVPGDPLLIDDGVIVQEACYSHFCERHPRTAVGITEDEKTTILVTVDGRTTSALGMTRAELADLMAELGAYRALNLDGGGSTTMYIAGQGVVNHPSDGSERVVASHLGFTMVPGDPGCCQYEEVPGATGVFKDIPDSSWAKPYAEALYAAGVTSGCQASPLLFCPDCVVDRAALGVFIARGLGLTPITPVTFDDVPQSAWYAGYVEALRVAGITQGCGTNNFCPDQLATRWEAAAFVFRGMGLSEVQPSGTFTDLTDSQAEVVEALAEACVTSGCSATTFCPDREITRAEVAKLVTVGFGIGGYAPCAPGQDAGTEAGIDAATQDSEMPDTGDGGVISDGSTSDAANPDAASADAANPEAGTPDASIDGSSLDATGEGGSPTNPVSSGAGSGDESSGCGCSVPGCGDHSSGWLLVALGLLARRRRRG